MSFKNPSIPQNRSVMKATKAVKKLARIEALLSNVSERYAASDHSIQEVLQDAKDSVIRAKEAVSLQASPQSEKTSLRPTRRRKATKGTAGSPSHSTPEPAKRKRRKLSAAGRANIVAATKKRWAAFHAARKSEKPKAAVKTAAKAGPVKAAPKRKLSAAGKAKLVANLKKARAAKAAKKSAREAVPF
jgi:hypothetical protein